MLCAPLKFICNVGYLMLFNIDGEKYFPLQFDISARNAMGLNILWVILWGWEIFVRRRVVLVEVTGG